MKKISLKKYQGSLLPEERGVIVNTQNRWKLEIVLLSPNSLNDLVVLPHPLLESLRNFVLGMIMSNHGKKRETSTIYWRETKATANIHACYG